MELSSLNYSWSSQQIKQMVLDITQSPANRQKALEITGIALGALATATWIYCVPTYSMVKTIFVLTQLLAVPLTAGIAFDCQSTTMAKITKVTLPIFGILGFGTASVALFHYTKSLCFALVTLKAVNVVQACFNLLVATHALIPIPLNSVLNADSYFQDENQESFKKQIKIIKEFQSLPYNGKNNLTKLFLKACEQWFTLISFAHPALFESSFANWALRKFLPSKFYLANIGIQANRLPIENAREWHGKLEAHLAGGPPEGMIKETANVVAKKLKRDLNALPAKEKDELILEILILLPSLCKTYKLKSLNETCYVLFTPEQGKSIVEESCVQEYIQKYLQDIIQLEAEDKSTLNQMIEDLQTLEQETATADTITHVPSEKWKKWNECYTTQQHKFLDFQNKILKINKTRDVFCKLHTPALCNILKQFPSLWKDYQEALKILGSSNQSECSLFKTYSTIANFSEGRSLDLDKLPDGHPLKHFPREFVKFLRIPEYLSKIKGRLPKLKELILKPSNLVEPQLDVLNHHLKLCLSSNSIEMSLTQAADFNAETWKKLSLLLKIEPNKNLIDELSLLGLKTQKDLEQAGIYQDLAFYSEASHELADRDPKKEEMREKVCQRLCEYYKSQILNRHLRACPSDSDIATSLATVADFQNQTWQKLSIWFKLQPEEHLIDVLDQVGISSHEDLERTGIYQDLAFYPVPTKELADNHPQKKEIRKKVYQRLCEHFAKSKITKIQNDIETTTKMESKIDPAIIPLESTENNLSIRWDWQKLDKEVARMAYVTTQKIMAIAPLFIAAQSSLISSFIPSILSLKLHYYSFSLYQPLLPILLGMGYEAICHTNLGQSCLTAMQIQLLSFPSFQQLVQGLGFLMTQPLRRDSILSQSEEIQRQQTQFVESTIARRLEILRNEAGRALFISPIMAQVFLGREMTNKMHKGIHVLIQKAKSKLRE